MKGLAILFLFAVALSCGYGYHMGGRLPYGYGQHVEGEYPYVHALGNNQTVRYVHPYPFVSITQCSVYTKDYSHRSCDTTVESHLCIQNCQYNKDCQKPNDTEPMVCCWFNCWMFCKPESYIEDLRRENEREKRLGLHWNYLGLPHPKGFTNHYRVTEGDVIDYSKVW